MQYLCNKYAGIVYYKAEDYDSLLYDKGFYAEMLFDKNSKVNVDLIKEKMDLLKIYELNPTSFSHRLFETESSREVGLTIDAWDWFYIIPIPKILSLDILPQNNSEIPILRKYHV